MLYARLRETGASPKPEVCIAVGGGVENAKTEGVLEVHWEVIVGRERG